MFKAQTSYTDLDRTCIIFALTKLHEENPMHPEYTKRFMDLCNLTTPTIEEFVFNEPNYLDPIEMTIRCEAAKHRAEVRKLVLTNMS